jgi:KDO2-lipid IV(A) lauroyltransferase
MLKAFLKYLAYRLGYALLQWMPRRALYKIADRAGDFAHAIYPEGRMAVQANLRHVLGQRVPQSYVEGLARSIFRNAARYYADMVSTPRLDIEKFARNDIITHHLANLKDAIATGRGVILASGHYGSPEVTAQFLRVYGIELYVVTEPMAPRALSRFIDGLRSSQGHRFEPVSFEAMKESFRVLRSGGVVALLYDRDVVGNGRPARFFGREALVPMGVADLAAKTGALIVPAYCRRGPNGRFDVWIHEPLEPCSSGDAKRDRIATTEALLGILEGYIREDPRQWIVLEPVWR